MSSLRLPPALDTSGKLCSSRLMSQNIARSSFRSNQNILLPQQTSATGFSIEFSLLEQMKCRSRVSTDVPLLPALPDLEMCSPKPDGRADHPCAFAPVESGRRGRNRRRAGNGSSLAPRAERFSFEFSAQLSRFAYRDPAFEPLIHEPPKMDGRTIVIPLSPAALCRLDPLA